VSGGSGTTHRVTLIPGDGTGPELTAATVRVLEATGLSFDWEVQHVGAALPARQAADVVPDALLGSVRETGVALKGPVSTPAGSGSRSVNIALRRSLDLFAQVRPCRSFPGVLRAEPNVDLIVMRETTEDLYAGIEYERGSADAHALVDWLAAHSHPGVAPDSALSIKPISEQASRRVFDFAFAYARAHGRRKVTAVHKATVMKFTDGLFLRTAREVAEANPDIEFDEYTVDSLCLALVRRPADFDLLVAPNLYGDILSDLAAGLVGGIGLAPGANYGVSAAVFEAAHGSAPKYAGQNKVNPMAMMLSAVLMLRHLEESTTADRLEAAIAAVLADGQRLTYDLKPAGDASAVGTDDVASAVIERLEAA
jgi:isocitrate dehydrogenase (NAD+)